VDTVDLSRLKAVLSNFPDQVLEAWLQPYANSEGWPPTETSLGTLSGRWRYLLKNKPLAYWQALTWKQVHRHISIQELDPQWQDIMVQMVLGAVQGQRNLYSSSIKDLSERFNRILRYFTEHGVFPSPPALLVEGGKLTILDGNHRMSAYFYAYGYFTLDPGADLQLKTQELQSYWIANEGN
jgi:hypothetical protein